MSESPNVRKELDDWEDFSYVIIREEGEDLLGRFLMEADWEDFDPMRHDDYRLMPKYFQPYVQGHENPSDRRKQFFLDHTNECLRTLPKDFQEIKPKLEPNLAQLHVVFSKYFEEKFDYLKKALFFRVEHDLVRDLINVLEKNLSTEARERIRKKEEKRKEKKRKREEERGDEGEKERVEYYELLREELLERAIFRDFKIHFSLIKDLNFHGITFNDVSALERELDKEREETYFREKNRIMGETYQRNMNREYNKMKRDWVKMTKEFLEGVYDYQRDFVKIPRKKKGLFG